MLGQRASEVNFHLENSKGLRGLGVEWEGWRQRRVASGQGSGMSGNPQSPPEHQLPWDPHIPGRTCCPSSSRGHGHCQRGFLVPASSLHPPAQPRNLSFSLASHGHGTSTCCPASWTRGPPRAVLWVWPPARLQALAPLLWTCLHRPSPARGPGPDAPIVPPPAGPSIPPSQTAPSSRSPTHPPPLGTQAYLLWSTWQPGSAGLTRLTLLLPPRRLSTFRKKPSLREPRTHHLSSVVFPPLPLDTQHPWDHSLGLGFTMLPLPPGPSRMFLQPPSLSEQESWLYP